MAMAKDKSTQDTKRTEAVPDSDSAPAPAGLILPIGEHASGVTESRFLDGVTTPLDALLRVTELSGENVRLAVAVEHSDDGESFTMLDTFEIVTKPGDYTVNFQTSKAYIRARYTVFGKGAKAVFGIAVPGLE